MATKKYWDGYDLDARRYREKTTAAHSFTYPQSEGRETSDSVKSKDSTRTESRKNGATQNSNRRSAIPVQWVSEYRKNFSGDLSPSGSRSDVSKPSLKPQLSTPAPDYRRRRAPDDVRFKDPHIPATERIFRDRFSPTKEVVFTTPARRGFKLEPLGTLEGSSPSPPARTRSASFSQRFQHVHSKVYTGLRRFGNGPPEFTSPPRRGCVSQNTSPDMKNRPNAKSPLRNSMSHTASSRRPHPTTSTSSSSRRSQQAERPASVRRAQSVKHKPRRDPTPRANRRMSSDKELTTTGTVSKTLIQPGGSIPPARKPSPKVTRRSAEPSPNKSAIASEGLPPAFSFADFISGGSSGGPKPLRGGKPKLVETPKEVKQSPPQIVKNPLPEAVAEPLPEAEAEPPVAFELERDAGGRLGSQVGAAAEAAEELSRQEEEEPVSAHSTRTPTPDSIHTLTNEGSHAQGQLAKGGSFSEAKGATKMPESDSATDLSHDSHSMHTKSSNASFPAEDSYPQATNTTSSDSFNSMNRAADDYTPSPDSSVVRHASLRSVSPGSGLNRPDTSWISQSPVGETLTFKPHVRRSSGVDVSLEVDTRPALNPVPRPERPERSDSERSSVDEVSPDRLLAAKAANAAAAAAFYGFDSTRDWANAQAASNAKKLYGGGGRTSTRPESTSPGSQVLPTIPEHHHEDESDRSNGSGLFQNQNQKRVELDNWGAGY